MSLEAVRTVWSDPRAADAEGPLDRDWLLVAVVVVVAVAETALRDDLVWRVPSLANALVGAAVLPWRRVQPFAAIAVAVGLACAIEPVRPRRRRHVGRPRDQRLLPAAALLARPVGLGP